MSVAKTAGMVSVRHTSVRVPAVALLLLVMCAPSLSGAGVKATFLYNLSNFSGTVPYHWVRESVDPERSEIYVVTGDSVAVFNSSGMEVYRFGDDLNIGVFIDVSVESDGHILILSSVGGRFKLTRCNYRGEPQAGIDLRGIPKKFAGISPGRLLLKNGKLYLADLIAKKVVVTDASGFFRRGTTSDLSSPTSRRNPGPITISPSPWMARGTCSLPSRRCSRPSGSPRRGNSPGSDPQGISREVQPRVGNNDRRQGKYLCDRHPEVGGAVFDKEFKFQGQFSHGAGTGAPDRPKSTGDRRHRQIVCQPVEK